MNSNQQKSNNPFSLEKIRILGKLAMKRYLYNYLEQNKELLTFMHEQPIWYRKLTRDPSQLQAMEIAALHYYKKTIPHSLKVLKQSANGIHDDQHVSIDELPNHKKAFSKERTF